jgi:PPM family protein phosphatase
MCLVFTHSEAGGHPTNEDAFEVRQHPMQPSCWVGSLADGQGGRHGAFEAARLACRIVTEEVLSKPITSLSSVDTWVRALRRADKGVLADAEAGFTTLIGFAVVGGHIVGASSGDSALWFAAENGRAVDLTERQSKNPPIGSGDAKLTPFIAKLSGSWVVLAMSDGGLEVCWQGSLRGGAPGDPREGTAGRAADAGSPPHE